MLLYFTDHTRQNILSVQDDHASLLEVSGACNHHSFIDLDLAQKVAILLQEFLLFGQILIGLLDESPEFDLVRDRVLLLQYLLLLFGSFDFCLLFGLVFVEERLYLDHRLHLIVSKGRLGCPT